MFEKSIGPGGAVTDGLKNAAGSIGDALNPNIDIEVVVEGEENEAVDAEPFLHGDNLAETLDADKVASIREELLEAIETDIQSRAEWEKTYKDGLKLLGLRNEEVTKPWAGACNVFNPLLAEAVVKFQAETVLETFPASGPVKAQIVGKITREREEAADRVKNDMNWRLTDEMTEYRQEHERLLWSLPIAGSAFKKVYYDASLERARAMFVPAEDFIVAYGTSDLQTAERYTHRMRKTKYEVEALISQGLYADVDIGEAETGQIEDVQKEKDTLSGVSGAQDDRHILYEVHVMMDIEGEDIGVAPYVVTINTANDTVLAIYRNWDEDDKAQKRRDYFVSYSYIVGFGFYGFGLLHLIGSHASAATSITRQLVDAGTLANLPGGFKTKGLRIVGDDTPVTPGEWRDVDVVSGALKDAMLPLPYGEPSSVLFQLLGNIVEDARRFASVSDATIADANDNAPVGTTLALLERTLKVMSAVQARVHASLKQEFKMLKAVIKDSMPDDYAYDVDPDRSVKRADYDIVDIIPVSDPNAATMAQRIMQCQAVMQLASQDPQLYDKVEIHREMLSAMGIKNAAKLLPGEDDQRPKDPISENMAVLMGKPIKAFAYQDHDAHLAAHQAFMQDPKIAMTMGQNPNTQLFFNALQAHIAEHAAYAYRKQAELMLGVALPDPNEAMPEEVEYQLSGLMAEATQKVLQTNQAAAAQQQAQQQAQDPLLQLEQEKVAIQGKELQVREKELNLRREMHMDNMGLKKEQQDTRFELDKAKLISDNHGKSQDRIVKIVSDRQKAAQQAAQAAAKARSKP